MTTTVIKPINLTITPKALKNLVEQYVRNLNIENDDHEQKAIHVEFKDEDWDEITAQAHVMIYYN